MFSTFTRYLQSWIIGIFNFLNSIVIDSIFGFEIRVGWLLIAFIVLLMVISLFWKGVRG